MKQMQNKVFLIADESEQGERLDGFLSARICEDSEFGMSLSRTAVQRLIADGGVAVNGIKERKNYRLKTGDSVLAILPEIENSSVEAQDLPLDIVHEDLDVLVINKPKGMVVHPAPGHANGTLVNALLFHCSDLSGIGGIKRPGIVHRIDKDTSGLLVVAKNDASHRSLADQFSKHSIEREYQAVCHGVFSEESGVIDRPIGRDPKDRKKFAVGAPNSKTAVTEYTLIENYGKFSHVALRLQTGRTHQIRVHLASVGHPVAGDRVYAMKSTPDDTHGQCLHAKTIGFIHPSTGELMRFDSSLPAYFQRFLSTISGKGIQ